MTLVVFMAAALVFAPVMGMNRLRIHQNLILIRSFSRFPKIEESRKVISPFLHSPRQKKTKKVEFVQYACAIRISSI